MKTILLLSAITFGILFPYGEQYTFLIRYLLMVLLFFSFLDIKFDKDIVTKKHFILLIIMIVSPVIIYYLINGFNHVLAQAAFIASAAPTAIAAPVIISLKRKRVEFTMISLILSNAAVAILLPFILPTILGNGKDISVIQVLVPVLITFAIPLLASQIFKYALPKVWCVLVGCKDSSFYILVANIYIATSDASSYIRNELSSSIGIVFLIGLTIAILCVAYFGLGWLIGGKEYAHEASQSLGQKNNAFTIWIALTFMNPVAALGPVFYVLFQNGYISWELYKHGHSKEQSLQSK
ncbi:MAG: hypothetical protein AB1521_03555 [Bacteroidota bacterium]